MGGNALNITQRKRTLFWVKCVLALSYKVTKGCGNL